MYHVPLLPPMTLGTKGFFGYQGVTMDSFKSMVLDRNNIVAIETRDKKYLVSCEDPQGLINLYKKLNL
jgi:hypothetical protein